MQTSTILLIVVAVLVVAAAGWFLYHLERSTQLRRRFGPEYERTLSEAGDRRTAESDLVRRAKRLERLEVRPLSPAERDRFLVDGEAHRRSSSTIRPSQYTRPIAS